MPLPSHPRFLVGALLGACAGVWVRAVGGLALNDFVDWPHFSHFLFDSLLIPTLSLYATAAYLVIGSPVFFWARRRGLLTLRLFASVGAVVGYLASSPMLLVPSWAALYVGAGVVSGVVGYAVIKLQ